MREMYRLHRHFFPDEGAILFLLKRYGERDEIEAEMVQLAKTVMGKAGCN